ncbi:MAG: tyrosine-type recombinase/integrase [Candidatus Delongbacteria bacterium]|nr:tyrosine-type recombinase/integrase [Candidatus Delongbacteria bacterium]
MNKIENAIQSFFFHCQYEKNLSSKTLKAYKTDIEQFKLFIIDGYFDSTSVDPNNIDKFIIKNYIKKIHIHKPKTVKRKIATLKAFFNYLEFEDIVIVNPFRKIKIKIKEGKKLPSTISLSNIKKLFRYMYNEKERYLTLENKSEFRVFSFLRDIAVLEILFGTGLRVSEVSNIKSKNIDLTQGWIKITGKGNKERTIPICDKEMKQSLKDYHLALREKNINTDFFFVNRLGTRFSEQSIRFMIRKFSLNANLGEHITPHMFRHTIATLLLERGVNIMYIQSLLGHSSINTTQIYIQINEKAKKRELDKKHPRRLFSMIDE